MTTSFAAIDLGATSGRVIVGTVLGEPGTERVELTEVGRFANEAVLVPPTTGDGPAVLTWDVLALWRGILASLRSAVEHHGPLAGIGIDSWAVDYARVDEAGRVLGGVVCYRDARTEPVLARVFEQVSAGEQYAINGLQVQPFTTAFQLLAEEGLDGVARVLLLPDLLGAWLTGVECAEITNASTTGLLDARTRAWSAELVDRLGLPAAVLPELIAPGQRLGAVRESLGVAEGTPVWTVGSHDTASAVVAVPLSSQNAAYISCGTWSLVGLELLEPVLTEASRAANVTNEAGVDSTVRYLKNVMGLWVLSQTLETTGVPLVEALEAAREAQGLRTVVDLNDARFLPPGDMAARIAALAGETGQPVPATIGEIVRCILDSLALAYRRSIREVAALAGVEVPAVHVVGGGGHNALLMELTAQATGLPVIVGPIEGAALGNVLVQARAAGVLSGSLADLREVVKRSTELVEFAPGPSLPRSPRTALLAENGGVATVLDAERPFSAWDEAERRAFGTFGRG